MPTDRLRRPMVTGKRSREAEEHASLLASHLAYHLRCLHEGTASPDPTAQELHAVVGDPVGRRRKVHHVLEECPSTMASAGAQPAQTHRSRAPRNALTLEGGSMPESLLLHRQLLGDKLIL